MAARVSDWAGQAGLFHVGPAASVGSLVLEAKSGGAVTYVVAPVDSKARFLDEVAETLRFPPWAGHNWDAAADLLADLSWLPAGPVTLIWAEPESLEDDDAAAYRTAVDVLSYAARSNRSRTLTVVLAHRGPH